jgi:hypothetical protein
MAAIDDHENGRRAMRVSLISSSSSNRGAQGAADNRRRFAAARPV